VARCWRMRRRVARIHRPSRAARRRRSRPAVCCRHAVAAQLFLGGARREAAPTKGAPPHMLTLAVRASTAASSIVAGLGTPAPSKSGIPASARPRLIMSAPVFAAPSAIVVRAHARMHGTPHRAHCVLLPLHACMSIPTLLPCISFR
jgi:hypothetical protein